MDEWLTRVADDDDYDDEDEEDLDDEPDEDDEPDMTSRAHEPQYARSWLTEVFG